jgi:hypothetical protein
LSEESPSSEVLLHELDAAAPMDLDYVTESHKR